jgi:hypothetical protein
MTRDEAERKKAQAATFMERIGQPDRAEEFEHMSTDEYVEHKGLSLSNPQAAQRRTQMATSITPTKTDLQDQIDLAIDALDDAYQPESTREDLAEAVGQALDILRGEDEEEEDETDEDDLTEENDALD